MTDHPVPPQLPEELARTIGEVSEVVRQAKATLLEHRVRDFSAADVLELTRIILEREAAQ